MRNLLLLLLCDETVESNRIIFTPNRNALARGRDDGGIFLLI